MSKQGKSISVPRRAVLVGAAKMASLAVGCAVLGGAILAPRQAAAELGKPQPEEAIEETIKRLFGGRELKDGESVIEFKLPIIAENGAVVQTRVEAKLPMTPDNYVKKIYILVDKNRRPMTAAYSFSPDSGAALIGTNLRLGGTSKVRAVAEMSDGTLYQAAREVRVTVGGCGG